MGYITLADSVDLLQRFVYIFDTILYIPLLIYKKVLIFYILINGYFISFLRT